MSGRRRTTEAINHSETGRNVLESAKEKGEQAVAEATALSRIASEMRRTAQNSDVLEIVEMASRATKESVQNFIRNEVGSKIEEGKAELQKSDEITSEQLSYNEKIQSSLSEMDGLSDFGREARERGRAQIESFNGELQGIAKQNETIEHDVEAAYRQQCQATDSLTF